MTRDDVYAAAVAWLESREEWEAVVARRVAHTGEERQAVYKRMLAAERKLQDVVAKARGAERRAAA